MKSSLQQKTVIGITWNLIERFSGYGIRLVIGVLLARLLTPADFGLVGMVTVFFSITQVFIESGLGQAYVQKKEATDLDADTIFYTNLLASLVAYGCIWCAAPVIARFYEQPSLLELTRVMGLLVIINAFNVIQTARLTRSVNFKRKTAVTLVSTFISGITGACAAYLGFGVWSLVLLQMVNRSLNTLGLWFTSDWRPRLRFSRDSFIELYSFGAWVLAAGIMRTVFDNIYVLVIGKLYPVAELGFYAKAKQYQRLSIQISGSISQVAFPVLSQLQNDKTRLRNGIRKLLTHTMFFVTPILITVMVAAHSFVMLLLTEKWAPMIPYMQLLCIIGFLYPIHSVNVQFLQAQGKSKLNFRLTLIKNSLRILNIILMYRFSVLFIIYGEIIVSFLALGINTYYTKRMIGYGIIEQFSLIKYTCFAAVLAGTLGYLLSVLSSSLYTQFAISLIVPVIVYMALQYLFDKKNFLELLKLKEHFRKKIG